MILISKKIMKKPQEIDIKKLNNIIKDANRIEDYLKETQNYFWEIKNYITSITLLNNTTIGYNDHPIIALLENIQLNRAAKEEILKSLVKLGVANIGVEDGAIVKKNILNYLMSVILLSPELPSHDSLRNALYSQMSLKLENNIRYRTVDLITSSLPVTLKQIILTKIHQNLPTLAMKYYDKINNTIYRSFITIILDYSCQEDLNTLLSQIDSEGQTSLAKLIEIRNDYQLIKKLLELGANPNIYRDNSLFPVTLLAEAIEQKNDKIITLLFNAQKDQITSDDITLLVNYMHNNIDIGNQQTVDIVKNLLASKFKELLSKAENKHDEVAIIQKFNKLKPLLLQQLLDNYVKPEISGDFEIFCNRFFIYCSSKKLSNFQTSATADAKNLIDQFIVNHKENAEILINSTDHIIYDKRNIAITLSIMLLSSTAWICYQDKINGETALYKAIKRNRIGIIRNLLNNGADPNIQNNLGETPLFTAVKKGNIEIIRELLEHSADITIKNNKGKSPVDIARDKKYMHIIKMLEPSTELTNRYFPDKMLKTHCIIL